MLTLFCIALGLQYHFNVPYMFKVILNLKNILNLWLKNQMAGAFINYAIRFLRDEKKFLA